MRPIRLGATQRRLLKLLDSGADHTCSLTDRLELGQDRVTAVALALKRLRGHKLVQTVKRRSLDGHKYIRRYWWLTSKPQDAIPEGDQ